MCGYLWFDYCQDFCVVCVVVGVVVKLCVCVEVGWVVVCFDQLCEMFLCVVDLCGDYEIVVGGLEYVIEC